MGKAEVRNAAWKEVLRSMDNVIKLAEKSDRACDWSIEDMFKDVLECIENGSIVPDKAYLIMLDTSGGKYDIDHRIVNMRNSEVLSILEVTKAIRLKQMGYIPT